MKQIKTTYKDFIGIFENIMDEDDCNFLINQFNNHVEDSIDGKFQMPQLEMQRNDKSIFLDSSKNEYSEICNKINNVLNACMEQYSDYFFTIKQCSAQSDVIKLQKTSPRGGYHVWHCEATTLENCNRILAWTIYLNDIPEGEGETEFLWQGLRVKPKIGTIAIFPAYFTHSHRGNPVYSCDKYIATGWFVLNK
jgi:hypothetical protein